MIFNSGQVTSGMELRVLARMLFENGLDFRPGNLIRLLVLLAVSLLTSTLSFFNSLYRVLVIERRAVRDDPIFVVGHWRTGSTYLHELMMLDDRLAAPNTLQCTAPRAYPLSCLVMAPFMMLSINKKRPMDNVQIGAFTPQEDEFALFRLTGFSPMKGLVFPRPDGGYFLNDEKCDFLPKSEKATARWIADLRFVMQLASGRRGRRVVLKNPCHSFRIRLLHGLFPDASFIFIHRDPMQVIPSTRRMWSILGPRNTLRGRWRDPSVSEVLQVYNWLERSAGEQGATIPAGRKIEVSFDDLEQHPEEVLERIYERLGMSVSPMLQRLWARRIAASKTYQKNRHALTPSEEMLIRSDSVAS